MVVIVQHFGLQLLDGELATGLTLSISLHLLLQLLIVQGLEDYFFIIKQELHGVSLDISNRPDSVVHGSR